MAAEQILEGRYSLAQKIWWLIAGRLLAALLLFAARALWVHGGERQAWEQARLPLLVALLLTAAYAIARYFSHAWLLQARIQFLIDILLVTWLIWTSDVINSPYISVYIVIIATSSLFLGPRDAMMMSVGCAVAFTASALAVLNGVGNLAPANVLNETRVQTIQSIGLFDVAFLVVGLLSARLAQRQMHSDVRLQAATQSLANLRALHERIVESIRSGLVTTDRKSVV